MLYVGPDELRWVLARFGISAVQLPLALWNATREHWLATALIPLATIAIGANMLFRRGSVTRIVGGVAAGMLAMTLAVNLVIEPAIANTLSPKEFAARTSMLAKSQTIEYFGSLDYAFVFYSGRNVKFVSTRDAPALVAGLEEQWPLMPAAFRADYRVVLRSNPTDLDGSGRMLLLQRTSARPW
jgi:hypothetical protein